MKEFSNQVQAWVDEDRIIACTVHRDFEPTCMNCQFEGVVIDQVLDSKERFDFSS